MIAGLGENAGCNSPSQLLWQDEERILLRTWRDVSQQTVLIALPAAERPTPETVDRLANEYGLRSQLESGWAARPLEFVRVQHLLGARPLPPRDHDACSKEIVSRVRKEKFPTIPECD
jgi:hypothetical protein